MYMNTVLEFKNVNYSYKDAGKELIILESVDLISKVVNFTLY